MLKEEKENFNINITHIKQSLMFKCSYFRKLLEKKNKNYMNNLSNVQSSNKINDNISDYSNNSNNKDKTENDKEKESIMENTQNGKIIKSGLLKKESLLLL